MRRPLLVAALVLVPVIAVGGLFVVRLSELFAEDEATPARSASARDHDDVTRGPRAATRSRVVHSDSDAAVASAERPRALLHDPTRQPTPRSGLVPGDQARGTVRLDLPPERLLARSEARAAWRERLSEEELELVRERLREKRNELTPEEREARRARREARQEALGVARTSLDSE